MTEYRQSRINWLSCVTKANFNTLDGRINVALRSTKHSSVEVEGHSAKVNVLLPWMVKIADQRWCITSRTTFDCTGCYDIQQVSWQGDYRKWWPPYQTTKGRKHQRCESGWLYTSNTVSIFSFLLKFMSTEQKSYTSPAIPNLGALG